MGKKSGITKGGRAMNPADRERKQQRAKELKRNKKQRTQVRHAIVKSRDPEGLIEQMSRLDDQEFDSQRQLSLNVIQEKRNKLRGAFIQIIHLNRQEKEEKKIKYLEKMLLEYDVERARKEENFRAQMFSQSEDFEEIPLPSGASDPDAASTPFSANVGTIGPEIPTQLQAAMKAGILKKTTMPTQTKKKHKYPPGPPPGMPPLLYDYDEDEEEEEERDREDDRRRRVRFGDQPRRRERDAEESEEDEDYAPVEIPESMIAAEQPPSAHHQPVFSRPVPSLAAPAIGSGPIMPGMAPPPPARPYQPAYSMMPPGEGMRAGGGHGQQPSKTGLLGNFPPADPHPSAIISAEPQVISMPKVDKPASETIISGAPQMRNIKREATRFVPTAVKIQRPLVQSVIGPRIPSSSVHGTTKLVPRSAKQAQKPGALMTSAGGGAKSVDAACDEFLKELEGFL